MPGCGMDWCWPAGSRSVTANGDRCIRGDRAQSSRTGSALELSQLAATSLQLAAGRASPTGAEAGCGGAPGPLVCALECPSRLDVDGDGCGDDVVVSQNLLRVDGRWFRVGTVDDHVAVGDWDCDGTTTPAMLRTATGDVFIFDQWSERGGEIHTAPVGRVPSGQALVVQSDATGCSQLIVTTPRGDVMVSGGVCREAFCRARSRRTTIVVGRSCVRTLVPSLARNWRSRSPAHHQLQRAARLA